jgi:hypothetical protein
MKPRLSDAAPCARQGGPNASCANYDGSMRRGLRDEGAHPAKTSLFHVQAQATQEVVQALGEHHCYAPKALPSPTPNARLIQTLLETLRLHLTPPEQFLTLLL